MGRARSDITVGGSIERWEDDTFREVFSDIFKGEWRKHDPYDLNNRVNARSSLYNKPNQASVFRAYQGWLALRSVISPLHMYNLLTYPQ